MLKDIVRDGLRRAGFELRRITPSAPEEPEVFEPAFLEILPKVVPFTMTSRFRLYALFKAAEYITKHKVTGDFVECGVWRGGSAMMMAHALMHFGDWRPVIRLYDTFEGMSQPGENDKSTLGESATQMWRERQQGDVNAWCYSPIEEVETNLAATGYPKDKLRFIKGKVEETIPVEAPASIALLRLDTDWYESTYHELLHLYPRLVEGGVLIIDDYGYWQGAKEAVDRYFDEKRPRLLLNRIDSTGRMGVKLAG